MTQYYGQAVAVFDGTKAGASTKDSTHHHQAGCEGGKLEFNAQSSHEISVEND